MCGVAGSGFETARRLMGGEAKVVGNCLEQELAALAASLVEDGKSGGRKAEKAVEGRCGGGGG